MPHLLRTIPPPFVTPYFPKGKGTHAVMRISVKTKELLSDHRRREEVSVDLRRDEDGLLSFTLHRRDPVTGNWRETWRTKPSKKGDVDIQWFFFLREPQRYLRRSRANAPLDH